MTKTNVEKSEKISPFGWLMLKLDSNFQKNLDLCTSMKAL